MNKSQVGILGFWVWIGLIGPGMAAPTDPKVLHLLNRLSLGIRPGDVQRVQAIGVENYIQQQLAPDQIPEPPALSDRLAQLTTLKLSPAELGQQFRQRQQNRKPPNGLAAQQTQTKQQPPLRQVVQQAAAARLLRATQSDRQLQEVMVDFWYNHFNVFSGKGLDRVLVGSYEQTAIRPHALGRFRDLLGATAKHPAMLFYLDNWQNTAPSSPGSRGRFTGLNENYARELMELHTLGVDGGYTQQDVITLAKVLTGWGLRRAGPAAGDPSGFYFDPKRHDASNKVFLGQPIQGGGMEEGDRALDILAKHPATAKHISYQLAQYFVADRPPPALVDRLTQRYLATDGNIREVLNTLFHSPEFWQPQSFNAKFKTPYQYVVSAVRATGMEMQNPQPIVNILQQLGMPLYGCPTPDGYKNTEAAWLNPDAMTRRVSFATAIATGRIGGAGGQGGRGAANARSTTTPLSASLALKPVDAVQLTATLGDRFSEQTRQTIAANPPQLRAALILGSPEFMRR